MNEADGTYRICQSMCTCVTSSIMPASTPEQNTGHPM